MEAEAKVERVGGRRKPNADSGAPSLDYWEIPPTGYSGAHYAVFPPALVEPLVKAMCPQRVCLVCGEPSRRIVATKYGEGAVRGFTSDNGTGRGGHQGIPNAARINSTLGWTDCGHGSIVCKSCSALVPYDHAVRRPRTSPPLQGGMGEEEVLGEPIESQGSEPKTPEGVRGLRRGVSGENQT